MILTAPGVFPGLSGTYITAQDAGQPLPVQDTAWSLGATAKQQVSLTSSAHTRPLEIVGVSVTMQLAIVTAIKRSWGKLGHIYAGLTSEQLTAINSGSSQPLLVLPSDSSLIQKIWDPDNDPLPPLLSLSEGQSLGQQPPRTLAVNANINPPIPLRVDDPSSVNVAVWIQPSLLFYGGNQEGWAMTAYNAKFTVYYDDGS